MQNLQLSHAEGEDAGDGGKYEAAFKGGKCEVSNEGGKFEAGWEGGDILSQLGRRQ